MSRNEGMMEGKEHRRRAHPTGKYVVIHNQGFLLFPEREIRGFCYFLSAK